MWFAKAWPDDVAASWADVGGSSSSNMWFSQAALCHFARPRSCNSQGYCQKPCLFLGGTVKDTSCTLDV